MVKHIRGKFRELYYIENRNDLRRTLKKLNKEGYRWRCGQGLGCTFMRSQLRSVLESVSTSRHSLYLMVSKDLQVKKDVVSYGVDLVEYWY